MFWFYICTRLWTGVNYGMMRSGRVAEWLKAVVSKATGQKCLAGSNPVSSAKLHVLEPDVFFDDFVSCVRARIYGSVASPRRGDEKRFINRRRIWLLLHYSVQRLDEHRVFVH